jgi:hypothetical protein
VDATDAIAQQEAQAEADKATADADEARANADKAKADARKAAAEASVAEMKVGVPDTPTIPTISAETDKSVKVEDTGGQAVAQLTASIALEKLAEDLANRVIGVARNPTQLHLPLQIESFVRESYEEGAIDGDRVLALMREEYGSERDRTGGGWTQESSADTIWIMDDLVPAETALIRQELSTRLTAFADEFKRLTPPPKAEDTVDQDLVAPLALAPAIPYAVSAVTGLIKFGTELVGTLRSRYALPWQAGKPQSHCAARPSRGSSEGRGH